MFRRFVICILLLCILSCKDKKTNGITESGISAKSNCDSKSNHMPLVITMLADLPDSLKPKKVALDTMPAPQTVDIPTKSGGTYQFTTALGENRIVPLEPPRVKMLPVLQNINKENILDTFGNSIILGQGGNSGFKTFNSDDGLCMDAVTAGIEDSLGNLWYGTAGGGISRFDGKSFKTFTTANGLTANQVSALMIDKGGNLWSVGIEGGLTKYDGKIFSHMHFYDKNELLFVNNIMEGSDGILWIGTTKGLVRYDREATQGSYTVSLAGSIFSFAFIVSTSSAITSAVSMASSFSFEITVSTFSVITSVVSTAVSIAGSLFSVTSTVPEVSAVSVVTKSPSGLTCIISFAGLVAFFELVVFATGFAFFFFWTDFVFVIYLSFLFTQNYAILSETPH